jgi:hypothetical protein
MLGVKNALRIDSFRVTRAKDRLFVRAAVAVQNTDINLVDTNVALTLGSQTLTIPAGGFVAMKNRFVCKNADVNAIGVANGIYDVNHCSFKLTIKETSITAPSGYVDLGIKFDADFNESELVHLPW